jgi:hypothetical protein
MTPEVTAAPIFGGNCSPPPAASIESTSQLIRRVGRELKRAERLDAQAAAQHARLDTARAQLVARLQVEGTLSAHVQPELPAAP